MGGKGRVDLAVGVLALAVGVFSTCLKIERADGLFLPGADMLASIPMVTRGISRLRYAETFTFTLYCIVSYVQLHGMYWIVLN